MSIGRPNDIAMRPDAAKDSVSSQASSARITCCICMPVKENVDEAQRKR